MRYQGEGINNDKQEEQGDDGGKEVKEEAPFQRRMMVVCNEQ